MESVKKTFFLFIAILVWSTQTYSQARPVSLSEGDKLRNSISSNLILTQRFKESKSSELFSIKLILNSNNTVDSICFSDRAPQEMISNLKKTGVYGNFDWEKLLCRKINNGDVVLIPIAVFPPDNFSSLPSYTQNQLNDLFKFKQLKIEFNCYFMNLMLISVAIEQR